MVEEVIIVQPAEGIPAPDFIEEAVIIDESMPDDDAIAPVDEEIVPDELPANLAEARVNVE